MFGRTLAVGVLLATLAAGSANAQEEYEKEGAYIGLLGSYTYFNDGGRSSGGPGIIIGAHMFPWLAAEGTYQYIQTSNTHFGTYSLKAILPLGMVQPWAKAGIGLMGGRPEKPFLFMGRFGLGADLHLTDSLALFGGAEAATALNQNNIFMATVGVTYYLD